MRVGDIDGRNVVYRLTSETTCFGQVVNFSGTMILEPNEHILFFRREVLPEIVGTGGKKDRFYDFFYPTSDGQLVNFYPGYGYGTMFFTDHRMLFLRRPEARLLSAMYGESSMFEMPDQVVSRARNIEMAGGMEFLEIPYRDVVRYERSAFFAYLWVRKSPERECILRLPRKDFNRIASLLDARGVPAKKRPVSIYEIPKVRLSLVVLSVLLALKAVVDRDATSMLLLIALCPVILIVFQGASSGGLKRFKAARWDSGIWHRIGKWAAYLIAGIFFTVGAIVSYLTHDSFPLIFCLFCGGVFLVVGLVLTWDWRNISGFRGKVPYRYKCPSCRAALSRRDLGCPGCGAPVWWKHLKKKRLSRWKQRRWNVSRR